MTQKKTKADYPNLLKGKGITSSEMAREIGRKGGYIAGQKHKAKKALKERIELAIDIYTKKLKEAALSKGELELANEIEQMGAVPYKLIEIMSSKAIKAETRLRALAEIMDRTDGKPIQKIAGADGDALKFSIELAGQEKEYLANVFSHIITENTEDKVEPSETGDNSAEDEN